MDLGTRIRREREKRGLKQEELAARVGVSVTTVRNWESGKFAPRNKLGKLEEVLLVDLATTNDVDRDDVSLRRASDAQLLAEVARRLADLDVQVEDLQRQLAAAGLGDPNVLPGPWAARARRPAPPREPDEGEGGSER